MHMDSFWCPPWLYTFSSKFDGTSADTDHNLTPSSFLTFFFLPLIMNLPTMHLIPTLIVCFQKSTRVSSRGEKIGFVSGLRETVCYLAGNDDLAGRVGRRVYLWTVVDHQNLHLWSLVKCSHKFIYIKKNPLLAGMATLIVYGEKGAHRISGVRGHCKVLWSFITMQHNTVTSH